MHHVREPARTPVARTYLLLIPYQSESVELQRQAERGVNGFQLGAADVADELTQTFWRDRSGLLDQDLSLVLPDGDRGTKDAWWRRA